MVRVSPGEMDECITFLITYFEKTKNMMFREQATSTKWRLERDLIQNASISVPHSSYVSPFHLPQKYTLENIPEANIINVSDM